MFITKLLQNTLMQNNSVRIVKSLHHLSASTSRIQNISKTTKNVFEYLWNPHETSSCNFSNSNFPDKKTFILNFETPPLKRKPLLDNKKPTKKSISTRNYLKTFGMIWNMNDRNSLLKSIVPNVVQKKDLSCSVSNPLIGVKRNLYTQFKANDPCKEEKRKELFWRKTCKPVPVMVSKNVQFRRLVKRYPDADRCDECCARPEPCPPRADDQLVIKKKTLRPYESRKMTVNFFESPECVPYTAPNFKPKVKLIGPQKRYDDSKLDRPACIPKSACDATRADAHLKLKRKRLPRIAFDCCCVPCAVPHGVTSCSLKRPRMRQGWQDTTKMKCDKKDICKDAERLDDVLCWKYVPKKLPLFIERTDCVCKKEPEKEKPFQDEREGCYCDMRIK